MINNQRGGFIFKLLIIPVGVAVAVGFFFLGYYVGKYRTGTGGNEIVLPLPQVAPDNVPKSSDFTFFKTLTDKGDKTVSIELKPKEAATDNRETKTAVSDSGGERGKASTVNEQGAQAARKEPPAAKRESPAKGGANSRIRYTLQLASYPEKQLADDDVRKMKQRGYVPFVVASELQGKGTWYRVRIGSFPSRAAAEKLQRQLRSKEGVSSFITIE